MIKAGLGVVAAATDTHGKALQDEFRSLLDAWEHENENSDWDVNPVLRRMAEILEEATNDFMQNNPDPMDDRHPFKSQPLRPLGHLLKMVTRGEFVNKLVISYLLARDNYERNLLAARLLLNLLPGIDTNVILSDADSLLSQLFRWAENSDSRELRAYSMALLGAAMGAEQAHQYRQNNIVLIPIALQRLCDLYAKMIQNYRNQDGKHNKGIGPINFAELSDELKKNDVQIDGLDVNSEHYSTSTPRKRHSDQDSGFSPPPKRSISSTTNAQTTASATTLVSSVGSLNSNITNPSVRNSAISLVNSNGVDLGNSNSSWRLTMQPILVGTHCLFPLSIEMEQRLILHYLGPTSEYQDNLSIVLEHHALDVVLNYLTMDGHNHFFYHDIRLLFDAIRYLSSLLIHRKFAWEFIAAQGIQKLLRINRQSLASTAVATCLYYLAYSSDIMEKVCHLPDSVLNDLIGYALHCIDHSHESGRASIAMFLAYALQFRAILERFDQQDGLRRLYNYVSTLTILQRSPDEDNEMLNDDHYSQSIATIKNAILAIRTYISSHVFLRMEHMKRQLGRHHHAFTTPLPKMPSIPNAIPSTAHPNFKPMTMDEETERGCMDYLIGTQCMLQPCHHSWKPIEDIRSLGIFRLLFNLIANYPDWSHFERSGKYDTLKLALEVFRLATVSPKVQMDACETLTIRSVPVQGIGLMLEIAEGDVVSNDPQAQRFALEVIINCLCGPTNQSSSCGLNYRFTSEFDRDLLPLELVSKIPLQDSPSELGQPKSTSAQGNKCFRLFLTPEHILNILWKCSQQNNAIMVLTNLLHKQQPGTDADLLRELACHALNGFARYEPVRQILSKLPIIAANELNALMQSPVLLEKRVEHSRFCEQARQLIERVSCGERMDARGEHPKSQVEWLNHSKMQNFAKMEMTQENLWRAAVVAQTRIKFNEKELLQLLYQHLVDIGFRKTARQLQAEAELPSIPASRIPSTPSSLPGFPRKNDSSFANMIVRHPLVRSSQPRPQNIYTFAGTALLPTTPLNNRQALPGGTSGNRLPVKLNSTTTNSGLFGIHSQSTLAGTSASSSSTITTNTFSLKVRPYKSLSGIVQAYFRNEHAMCKNPVANCPPFSLFYPHRCPEPKLIYTAPANLVSRFQSRPNPPYRCTMETLRQADRRVVFSRFRQWKTLSEENEIFTCCEFSPDDERIFMGTYAGEIFWFNVRTGAVDFSNNCHHSAVTAIRPRKNNLILSSSAFVKPFSVLWKLEENLGERSINRLIDFNEDSYAEFGNLSISQIVGTQGPKAVVYDTETALPLVQLFDERLANHYTWNRAYFDPLDELVLSDGILFDPKINPNGRVVHKFDKLNSDISGVFHPKGTEVIINSEVWDLRTHRLLHTIPALNQSKIVFNSTGTIIFGIVHQDPMEVDDRLFQVYGNYFRTLDSTNYQVITTHDVRKPLLDLCCGHTDNFVGLIETSKTQEEDTNFCKLYEIGRRRDAEEEDEEEQEENNPEDEEEDGISISMESSASSSAESNNADSDANTANSVASGGSADGEDDDDDATFIIANEENEGEEEDEVNEIIEDEEDSSDEDYELSSSDFSP